MALSISIFLIIVLFFIFTIIASWIYSSHCLINNFLSFKDLDESLINKYNLMDYSLIDKKSTWINLSIWNITLYLFNHVLLLFSFLIFKDENNSLFITSIILIILGNIICLTINFVISFFLWKKNYYKNKEKIEINVNQFVPKLDLYKHVEIDHFIKTDIYNFRDKIYQKYLNKSLTKIKFKSNNQWLVKHYIVFLKYSHFFVFNLNKSNIKYLHSNFLTICDQTLNNLMVKINENYTSKIKH